MKKLISIILALTLVLPCVSIFVLDVNAKDNYDEYKELFEQRKEYIYNTNYFWGEQYYGYPYSVADVKTILLYTSLANEISVEKEVPEIMGDGYMDVSLINSYNNNYYVVSPEIDEIYDSLPVDADGEYKDYGPILYHCVRYFDISKEELKKANKKMQDDPDSIRELLSFLTDEEFEDAKYDNGLFCACPLQDYEIEALYIEDKFIAYNLLVEKYGVYVEEYDETVCIESKDKYYHDFWDDYANCDLTSQIYGDFFEYCEALSFNIPEIPYMKAEREKQLANPKTGEPVYLVPVAIASLTLGIYAAYPRKKRKLEA